MGFSTPSQNSLPHARQFIRSYYEAFDNADSALSKALPRYTATDFHWRGMHPFGEQHGAEAVLESFWVPLHESFSHLQRREDIFFVGTNYCDDGASVWSLSAGNLLGLFDRDWLGIPRTRRMLLLPYAEFHRIADGQIVETALFLDILSAMYQAGVYPLPPMSGSPLPYKLPPRTNDGVIASEQNPDEGRKTMNLVERLIADLDQLNKAQQDECPPEFLAQTWHKDMIWHGPMGIGSSYTIERYQHQHQFLFRKNLGDKVFNGHVTRIAEGNYCGFFGWPNLNNRNKGGFLGLPASEVHAPMRVVDIYRRAGDKVAENWIFMDILHYLHVQGLDLLQRMRELRA